MAVSKKIWHLLCLFCLIFSSGTGQNPVLSDSLIKEYNSRSYKGDELLLLKEIVENATDPDKKLHFSEVLISKTTKEGDPGILHSAYLQKGNALQLKGDFVRALDSYFESLDFASRSDNRPGIGAVTISIADTYSMIGNSKTSEDYYTRGIAILREVKDSVFLASALLNAGDEYFNSGNYEEALDYFRESALIFSEIDYPLGTAYNLGNVGMVLAEQGRDELAKENINQAIEILEDLQQYYPISVYLTYMSDIYAKQNNLSAAFSYAERSLELAQVHGLKDQISEANLQLSELHGKAGNFREAHDYFKDHIIYRDSVTNVETVQQMADLRTNFEVSQMQTEVDLLAQQKRTQRVIAIATGVALILIMLLALGLYRRNKFVNKTSKIIEKEKNRSDLLLRNILPDETARELKDFGRVKSQRFESVSVLFTDFKDFTRYSEGLSPEVLVESVDFYFSRFDIIIEKYNLEKIKTVGDCYMCAGGLPFPSEDHAHKTVLAALEICKFVKSAWETRVEGETRFEVRIGINTGPVVAGVVGTKKFAYDIWGDTVNIASRMESNSDAGKINISRNTYELIKENFICHFRGGIEVKNKGIMQMYYVSDVKEKDKVYGRMEGLEVMESARQN